MRSSCGTGSGGGSKITTRSGSGRSIVCDRGFVLRNRGSIGSQKGDFVAIKASDVGDSIRSRRGVDGWGKVVGGGTTHAGGDRVDCWRRTFAAMG